MVGLGLFTLGGVQPEGHWTVVGEGDPHVGSEAAGQDRAGELVVEGVAEGLVEQEGLRGDGGAEEGGAIALFGRGEEGELGDEEGFATNFGEGKIQGSRRVREEAKFG